MELRYQTKEQLELIRAFPYLMIDEVLKLKDALADFFAEEAQKEMDRLWESGKWNMQKLESLKTQHHRTPYK